MTHEQKPESAEFRTLETQVSECASNLRASLIALEEKLYVEFSEAEARGAAEQRRKDAEGAERWEFEEPEYHDQGMGSGLEDRSIHDRYEAMGFGWDEAIERCIERIPEELYTRPANVAALEARVKELEEEAERRIADAVAVERERCATLVDHYARDCMDGLIGNLFRSASSVIREGGAHD